MTYEYKATVLRVLDIDTIDLLVELRSVDDLGFRISAEPVTFRDRFRLWDIDGAERGQPGWAEAKAAMEAKLPVGTVIRIETYHPRERDERDSFGRWLATIYLGTENVNLWAIDQGHAIKYVR